MTTAYQWNGAVGATWAQEWRRTDRSFADISRHLDTAILAVAPAVPFRAIDIGGGAGATSLTLAAARPDASVTGVDLSAELVTVASQRAAALALSNVRFIAGDAPGLVGTHAPADLIVSRHGVMFFDDPVAAFAALRSAAAPGARLVFTCFQHRSRNAFASDVGAPLGLPPTPDGDTAPGPFAFADRDRVAAILGRAGWSDVQAAAIDVAYCVVPATIPSPTRLPFSSASAPPRPRSPRCRRAIVPRRSHDWLRSWRRTGAVLRSIFPRRSGCGQHRRPAKCLRSKRVHLRTGISAPRTTPA
jgi:SAM-dependent methyltransferase